MLNMKAAQTLLVSCIYVEEWNLCSNRPANAYIVWEVGERAKEKLKK